MDASETGLKEQGGRVMQVGGGEELVEFARLRRRPDDVRPVKCSCFIATNSDGTRAALLLATANLRRAAQS